MSPGHPTADGRFFGDLEVGDDLGGIEIVGAALVPYRESHTHDILPASDTGVYFAGGVPVGSTLHQPAAGRPAASSPRRADRQTRQR
jgi:hypothetical protein